MNLRRINLIILLVVPVLIYTAVLRAQEKSTVELAKAAQNPIANMRSFLFQDNTSYNIGSNDRTQNKLNIQLVAPNADGRIISHAIIPIIWQPDLATESETSTGLGDISFTAFYSPATQGVIWDWGIGPTIQFPTGGEKYGSEKGLIGPSLVVLAMPGQWVTGFLINNLWSFTGKEEAADVNQMLIQPFLN